MAFSNLTKCLSCDIKDEQRPLQQEVLQNEQYCQYIHQRGHTLGLACADVKKDVGDDSHGDAFGDGVHERHCEDRDVSGDRLKRIFPADFDDLLHHQETDDDQGRSRREGRDRMEQGGEEQSQDKQSAGGDGGQACASAFCNT